HEIGHGKNQLRRDPGNYNELNRELNAWRGAMYHSPTWTLKSVDIVREALMSYVAGAELKDVLNIKTIDQFSSYVACEQERTRRREEARALLEAEIAGRKCERCKRVTAEVKYQDVALLCRNCENDLLVAEARSDREKGFRQAAFEREHGSKP